MRSEEPLRSRCLILVGLWWLAGCASSPEDVTHTDARGLSSPDRSSQCVSSDNLLADTEFLSISRGPWQYTQHAGDLSFEVTSNSSELKIRRVGVEPWMLFRQRVPIESHSAGILRFTADLKGDLHGAEGVLFEPIAGLFLQGGPYADKASSAEHDPNRGKWDWQTVTVEVPIDEGSVYGFAGFTHQADGTLWARNPSLTLITCTE